MEGHTSQQITDSLMEFLSEQEINIEDCRGQSYDNASNMSGQYLGVQARIKELSPYATFVPCFAHSLNLVGNSAANCCGDATKFFLFLESIYAFFAGSTYRWGLLLNGLASVGTPPLTVKSLSQTRWSARADATKAMHKGYTAIKNVLKVISENENQKAECRQRARGLISNMEKLEIGIMIIFWDKILQRFQATSAALQASNQDLNTACSLYNSLYQFVESLKSTFAETEANAKELTQCDSYRSENQRHRKRNKKYDDDCTRIVAALVEPQTPSQTFHVQTFLKIIDSLLSALSKRQAAYSVLTSQFGFFRRLSSLSSMEIKSNAANIISAYPKDVDNSLADELIQFSGVLKTDLAVEIGNGELPHEMQMYNMIVKNSLEGCFPNVEVVLRIYLSLMVTNCSGERSFSKLNRIKNLQRTTMAQDRLNSLMIMSIECELMQEIDISSIISEFSHVKCRKVAL